MAIGLIIDLWPQTAPGSYNATGYSSSFGLIVILQLAGATWYFLASGRKKALDNRMG